MASFNRVVLAGHMTRDIEIRFTPKGTAVGQSGLAINRKWKTESGEEREEVTFVDFSAWGRSAETLAQYTKKGSALLIEGRLKLDQWDDKQTGQKRSKLSVVVESFQFLGEPKGDRQAAPARPPAKPEAAEQGGHGADSSDDVPF